MGFCERILNDTGVVVAPGIDHDPVDGHRFIRFSFAVSTAQVAEAIERLVPWFAAQGARA
jgi:aspartate/methionine/tyrosine aminotransferase